MPTNPHARLCSLQEKPGKTLFCRQEIVFFLSHSLFWVMHAIDGCIDFLEQQKTKKKDLKGGWLLEDIQKTDAGGQFRDGTVRVERK